MRRTGVKHSAYALSNAVARENLAAGNPKYHAGETPLEQEAALKVIEPTSEQQLKELMKMIDLMYEEANAQQRKALDFYKGQMAVDGATNAVKMRFLRRFYFWLLGRGTNDDHAKTLWGRGNVAVYNAEVAAYIEQFVEKRLQYALQLSLLAQRIPVSLNGFYLYFKYIVNGELKRAKGADNIEFWDLNNDDFLKDFEVLAQYFDNKVNYADLIKPAATRPENAAPFGAKGTPFVGVRGSTEPYPAGHENDGESAAAPDRENDAHLPNDKNFLAKAASGIAKTYGFDGNNRGPPPPETPAVSAKGKEEADEVDYAESPAEEGFVTSTQLNKTLTDLNDTLRKNMSPEQRTAGAEYAQKVAQQRIEQLAKENKELKEKGDEQTSRRHEAEMKELKDIARRSGETAEQVRQELVASRLQREEHANRIVAALAKDKDAGKHSAEMTKLITSSENRLTQLEEHLKRNGGKAPESTAEIKQIADSIQKIGDAVRKVPDELSAIVKGAEADRAASKAETLAIVAQSNSAAAAITAVEQRLKSSEAANQKAAKAQFEAFKRMAATPDKMLEQMKGTFGAFTENMKIHNESLLLEHTQQVQNATENRLAIASNDAESKIRTVATENANLRQQLAAEHHARAQFEAETRQWAQNVMDQFQKTHAANEKDVAMLQNYAHETSQRSAQAEMAAQAATARAAAAEETAARTARAAQEREALWQDWLRKAKEETLNLEFHNQEEAPEAMDTTESERETLSPEEEWLINGAKGAKPAMALPEPAGSKRTTAESTEEDTSTKRRAVATEAEAPVAAEAEPSRGSIEYSPTEYSDEEKAKVTAKDKSTFEYLQTMEKQLIEASKKFDKEIDSELRHVLSVRSVKGAVLRVKVAHIKSQLSKWGLKA